MFNQVKSSRIKFSSNPSLPEAPCFVPEEKDGLVRNKLTYIPQDNKSVFDGIVYDPGTMSLAAKLNAGIPMKVVSIGQIENDPSFLQSRALSMEAEIFERLNNLQNDSSVEPSKTE